MKPYLAALPRQSSITDLGCSAGLNGFLAYEMGFRKIRFVDHDVEYLDVVREVGEYVGATDIEVTASKFSQIEEASDVVFSLAIVHWLYSSTEYYQSLSKILAKFAQIASHSLFIEWVAPDDPCFAKWPMGRPSSSGPDPYSTENFIGCLQESYPFTRCVGRTSNTRSLWLGSTTPTTSRMSERLSLPYFVGSARSVAFGLPAPLRSGLRRVAHRA
jgi:hypothetical protein